MTDQLPTGLPLVTMVDGAPMIALRDLLKATGHRPYFIQRGLLPMASVRRFLRNSDKPLAPGLLQRLEAALDKAKHPHLAPG